MLLRDVGFPGDQINILANKSYTVIAKNRTLKNFVFFQQEHPFKIKSQKIKEKIESIVSKLNVSNQYDVLADCITPHWKISYEEELRLKENFCQSVLTTISNKFLPSNKLPIDVEKIIGSVS